MSDDGTRDGMGSDAGEVRAMAPRFPTKGRPSGPADAG